MLLVSIAPNLLTLRKEIHSLAGNAETSNPSLKQHVLSLNKTDSWSVEDEAMNIRSCAAAFAVAFSSVDPVAFNKEAAKKYRIRNRWRLAMNVVTQKVENACSSKWFAMMIEKLTSKWYKKINLPCAQKQQENWT